MKTARPDPMQATHFSWATAFVFSAAFLLLMVTGFFALAACEEWFVGFFLFLAGVFCLNPVRDLKVTTLRFDAEADTLDVERRVWWKKDSSTESHRMKGLLAIIWRDRSRTPGLPFARTVQSHERETAAVFDDGREVVLFTHRWLPAGQDWDRRLAEHLGVDYRKEIVRMEVPSW